MLGASTMVGIRWDAEADTVPAFLSLQSCKMGVRAITEVEWTGFGD